VEGYSRAAGCAMVVFRKNSVELEDSKYLEVNLDEKAILAVDFPLFSW